MEAPSPSYILSRTVLLMVLVVAILFGVRLVKKKQRQAAIVSELRSLSSDSAFFQQFYAEDARKSLVRAIALIAEAKQLGTPPDASIDSGLGIDAKAFFSE